MSKRQATIFRIFSSIKEQNNSSNSNAATTKFTQTNILII